MDLPAELRNMIYAEVFGQAYEIHVRMRSSGPFATCRDTRGHYIPTPLPKLNILATCRSIHDEASSMFYGSVRFHLTSAHLTRFLTSISMHAKYIRSVSLSDCSNGTRKAMVLLSAVKELDVLRIDSTYYLRSGRYYAYRLKPLLQALQEKINDREAVCRKIVFAVSRLETEAVASATFAELRNEAFRYLKDRMEPELDDETIAPASGPVVRRDTGRPKRAVVKTVSYAEDD